MTATEPRTALDALFSIPRWQYTDEDGITSDVVWLNDVIEAVQEAEASGASTSASAEAEGLDVEAVRLREAIQHFVDTAYPNNGEGRTDRLTWTVPEHAFGRLRAALATPPTSGSHEPEGLPAAPAALDVDTLRQALNDYDAFVAFREDDGREVTIKDRHDWAERWVARLSSSEAGDG